MAAIDGDTDINKQIMFELEFSPGQDCKCLVGIVDGYQNSNMIIISDSDLISIDPITGDLEVQPINRDALNQEVFPFSVCI